MDPDVIEETPEVDEDAQVEAPETEVVEEDAEVEVKPEEVEETEE